jgi:hypothetical protein
VGRLVDPAELAVRSGRPLGPGSAPAKVAALAIGTVLACVKALYDDTTVLPFKAYQGDRNGPHARSRSSRGSSSSRSART